MTACLSAVREGLLGIESAGRPGERQPLNRLLDSLLGFRHGISSLEISLSHEIDVCALEVGERSGTTVRSQSLLHTRYLRQIDSTSSLEVFPRVSRDECALLDRRGASGGYSTQGFRKRRVGYRCGGLGGLRGRAVERGAGRPTYGSPRRPGSFGYLAYWVQITETTLLNTPRALLRLADNLDDGRIADTAPLQVVISECVSLNASFGLEHDSRPHSLSPR